MKGSRFDPKAKKQQKKKAQVQPYAERITSVNTSHLNHTKSNTLVSGSESPNSEKKFLEELDCTFCQDTIQNGQIAEKMVAASAEAVKKESPMPSRMLDWESIDASHSTTPPIAPATMISAMSETSTVKTVVGAEEIATDSREKLPVMLVNDVQKNEEIEEKITENETESEILYRSVSTIPLDDNADYGENDEELMISSELNAFDRVKSCSLPQDIGESVDFDCESAEYSPDHMHHFDEPMGTDGHECDFCDFVNKGSGRSWDDLDKDVSILMETADKLSLVLAEKEMILSRDAEKNKIIKVPQESHTLRQSSDEHSFDDNEEIVEEKNVSLSFLKRFKVDGFKEKVEKLRNKKKIGISMMKTSKGKRLMVFSDGVNTYQIHGK